MLVLICHIKKTKAVCGQK